MIFDAGEPLAFQSACEHDCRPVGCQPGFFISAQKLGDAVPVYSKGLPSERLPASLVDFQVMLEHGRLALPQTIDVDRSAEITESPMSGPLSRFPHGAFGGFTIAKQNKNTLVGVFEFFGVQSNPYADRQALAERAGRHIHERQSRRWVPLQVGVDPP